MGGQQEADTGHCSCVFLYTGAVYFCILLSGICVLFTVSKNIEQYTLNSEQFTLYPVPSTLSLYTLYCTLYYELALRSMVNTQYFTTAYKRVMIPRLANPKGEA